MMMVDDNRSGAPWDNTVPQQMPWMNTYDQSSVNVLFGQPPIAPNRIYTSEAAGYQQITPSNSSITDNISPLIPTCVNRSVQQPYPLFHDLTRPDAMSQQPCMMGQIKQTPSAADFSTAYVHSLTHLPNQNETVNLVHRTKRTSQEMEDDSICPEEPPTKQVLSEAKLFQRFGSLNLDIDGSGSFVQDPNDDEDDDDDKPQSHSVQGRDEFNQYVYLLFKDKKEAGSHFQFPPSTIDRLAREERDKLSKAVILYTPPRKNPWDDDYQVEDDDDEEFTYKDHRDFLKNRQSSVVITDVTDCEFEGIDSVTNGPDDVMED